MSSKETFINKVFPYAKKSSEILKEKGIIVDPRFIASQWGHETGYGQNTGAKYNNLAGIFAYPNSPYGISGKKYSSLDDFVVDYSNVLSNSRYSAISGTTNVTDFARALKSGGYATDPNYAYAKSWLEGFNIATDIVVNDHVVGSGSSGTGQKPILNDSIFESYEYENETLQTDNPLDLGLYGDKSMLDQIFDFVKVGFVQIIVFVLILLFLYASLIKSDKTILTKGVEV